MTSAAAAAAATCPYADWS